MGSVDCHTHFFPAWWPDFAERFSSDRWPWLKRLGQEQGMIMVGDQEFRPVTSACWDVEARLADMDRDGVDVQVVAPTPVTFGYGRPAREALEMARFVNDAGLELRDAGGGRILTLCQVPLQDVDLACGELRRAVAAGHVGVEIGNHVGDRELDDGAVQAFLECCIDLDVAVLVHPWDMRGPDSLDRFMLRWTVGMPAETHLGIATMILAGVFDRLDERLRICFAHGGGSFATNLGRLHMAWTRRGGVARGRSEHPPDQYLGRFFVDSLALDERVLRLLVDVFGSDQVVLGSDYPFPLGEERAGKLVRDAAWLDGVAKERILSTNARRLLGSRLAEEDSRRIG